MLKGLIVGVCLAAAAGDDGPLPEGDPQAEARARREERLREQEAYEREHPPGLGELWAMGGAGMYPVLLGALFGLAAGATGLLLGLMRSRRGAAITGGLGLAGGGWAFVCGWLGFLNGMIGMYEAVAHVNPDDREMILALGTREASVCWQFGTLSAVPCLVLGGVALALAVRGPAVVGAGAEVTHG